MELIFDAINLARRTARLIGNQGAVTVSATSAKDAIFLIESTLAGYLQLTAIYEPLGADGQYKAVHSRHTFLLTYPAPSQYYGACRPLLSN